jgi:formate transporter
MTLVPSIDAFIPPEMAAKAEEAVFLTPGFEHCVANMYFIPLGLFLKAGAPAVFWEAMSKTAADYRNLTWGHFFFTNLIPVTLGNI